MEIRSIESKYVRRTVLVVVSIGYGVVLGVLAVAASIWEGGKAFVREWREVANIVRDVWPDMKEGWDGKRQ